MTNSNVETGATGQNFGVIIQQRHCIESSFIDWLIYSPSHTGLNEERHFLFCPFAVRYAKCKNINRYNLWHDEKCDKEQRTIVSAG